jgi:probable HAF family extracellular repeat protein
MLAAVLCSVASHGYGVVAGGDQTVAIVDLGAVFPSSDGGAQSINDHGDVAGGVVGPNGDVEAFLFSDGVETDLGNLPGGRSSVAHGINDHRHVVGTAGAGTGRAFLYADGGLRDLGTLGGTSSAAYSINAHDEIVGLASLAGDQEFHPVLWANGQLTDLGSPSGTNGIAYGINDNGDVVGTIFLPHTYRAFLYTNGAMNDLGTLGGIFSSARAINKHGQIVGVADPGNGTAHAFQFSDGVMADLGTFGFTGSDAFAINDSGDVVGTVRQVSGDPLAFLWTRGQGIVLNNLLPAGSGWSLSTAFGVNNSDAIVGLGYHNGQPRAYLLMLPANCMTATIEECVNAR